MKSIIIPVIFYYFSISFISAAVTIKDKNAAGKHKWRVPESVLLLLGLIGGAAAMLITMKKIRHKTKHMKFMIVLPVEILLHIILCALFYLTITG